LRLPLIFYPGRSLPLRRRARLDSFSSSFRRRGALSRWFCCDTPSLRCFVNSRLPPANSDGPFDLFVPRGTLYFGVRRPPLDSRLFVGFSRFFTAGFPPGKHRLFCRVSVSLLAIFYRRMGAYVRSSSDFYRADSSPCTPHFLRSFPRDVDTVG